VGTGWIATLVPGEDYAIEVKDDGEGNLRIFELNERQRRRPAAATARRP